MAGRRKKLEADQDHILIRLEDINMVEESVPLQFSNIARMHSDPVHTTIVFGYLRPGKLNEFQTGHPISAEVVARVALPTETLLRVYGLIGNMLDRLKKDGFIEIENSSTNGEK